MRGLGALLTTLFISAIVFVAAGAAATGWSSAGSLSLPREGAVAVPLADGKVLVVGGWTQVGEGYDTKTVEIYDPVTNSWSTTGSLTNGRTEHVATALADGRVLVTGGENGNICTDDRTTEIYNPSTGTWSFSGNIGLARAGATATLLGNGKVLLAGGGNRCGSVFTSAELYDPATGTWSATGSMTTPREYANAVLLSNGRVLMVGGVGVSPFGALSSAEVYNPATGTWSATGSMSTTRHNPSLARLADGRVMAAGGWSGTYYGGGYYTNGPGVEIWSPGTGLWSATGAMNAGRSGGTLSLLPDGTVLAAGGYNSSAGTTTSTAELWNPGTGTWADTTSLATGRFGHTATVLTNGKVLVAGGESNVGSGWTYPASAELYSYLKADQTITFGSLADRTLGDADFTVGATASSGLDVSFAASGACTIDAGTVHLTGVGTCTITASQAGDDDYNAAPDVSRTFEVNWPFAGFLAPVDNEPTLNTVKAGSAIPVKFSLGGDRGLDIFATGYPKSGSVACEPGAQADAIEQTVTAGGSSLTYDVTADRYTYVWKTDRAWSGCRILTLGLSDGSDLVAYFRFTR